MVAHPRARERLLGTFTRSSLGVRERRREQSLGLFNPKGKQCWHVNLPREVSLSDEAIKDGDN